MKARELREPLPPDQQLPNLPVPLNKLHNAAFLELEEFRPGHLLPDTLVDPDICPDIEHHLREFFIGTLAYFPQDRWTLHHVMRCGLWDLSKRLLQQLNDPDKRQRLLDASVASSNAFNEKQISVNDWGAADSWPAAGTAGISTAGLVAAAASTGRWL